MLAWLYDEDRWPSGFAGGLVTKDERFRERYIQFSPEKTALGKNSKKTLGDFIIDDLSLWIIISKNHDAAGTAIEYGNVCQDVFPALGYICSTVKVKKYDVNIEPDFIGTFSSAQFVFNCSFRPIFYLNAVIVMAVKLLFKVVFKVLFAKPNSESNENKDTQNIKGGAQQ